MEADPTKDEVAQSHPVGHQSKGVRGEKCMFCISLNVTITFPACTEE